MTKLKELSKPYYWRVKAIYTIFMIIGYWSTKNIRIRRTPRLRIIFSVPLAVIVGIATNLIRLSVIPLKNILVYIRETSKANLLTLWQLALTLLLSGKTKSKRIGTWLWLHTLSTIKRGIMPINAQAKSLKTSVSFGGFRFNDWD